MCLACVEPGTARADIGTVPRGFGAAGAESAEPFASAGVVAAVAEAAEGVELECSDMQFLYVTRMFDSGARGRRWCRYLAVQHERCPAAPAGERSSRYRGAASVSQPLFSFQDQQVVL
jgi:hypothetical protein